MELVNWLDKSLSDLKESMLYNKYFDSSLLEKVMDEYYLANCELGIDLVFNKNLVVRGIHLFSGRQKEMNPFVDQLPLGLDFSFSRETTGKMLGMPDKKGGGASDPFFGNTPFWDKYDFKNFYLHLQFTSGDEILDLVTLEMK